MTPTGKGEPEGLLVFDLPVPLLYQYTPGTLQALRMQWHRVEQKGIEMLVRAEQA